MTTADRSSRTAGRGARRPRARRHLRHDAGQRPLPDRVHRIQRRAAGAAGRNAGVLHRRSLPRPGCQRAARRRARHRPRPRGRSVTSYGLRHVGRRDPHAQRRRTRQPHLAGAGRNARASRTGRRGAPSRQGRRRDRAPAYGVRHLDPGARRPARRTAGRPHRAGRRSRPREPDARPRRRGDRLRDDPGQPARTPRSRTTARPIACSATASS